MKRRVSNFAKQTKLNGLAVRKKELKDAAAYANRRKLLKEQYGDLFNDVAALLYEADPMGINAGCNPDEYEPEVGTILPRLSAAKSVHDVEKIIYREFRKWFGGGVEHDYLNIGPRENYQAISVRVWEMWNDFKNEKTADAIASVSDNK